MNRSEAAALREARKREQREAARAEAERRAAERAALLIDTRSPEEIEEWRAERLDEFLREGLTLLASGSLVSPDVIKGRLKRGEIVTVERWAKGPWGRWGDARDFRGHEQVIDRERG